MKKVKKKRRFRKEIAGGKPCPKCEQLMQRYEHGDGRWHYYRYWDVCSICRHIQHYGAAKHDAAKHHARKKSKDVLEVVQQTETELRVGIERDVRELAEISTKRVLEGREKVVWFDTEGKVAAEVQRRIDEMHGAKPQFRWTRMQREDGTWGGWEPF